MGAIHNLKVLVWGESPPTKEERWLVRKIDFFILTYCCLSFFFNYLDRAALANAYVSGLKEDLHLKGDNFNVLGTCLTVGYVIGQVPHAIIIQKVPPRIWFPLMCIVWGALTMVTAAAQTFQQLCVIRFFQGVAEASTYSGTQYIIGSWYKPSEIGKRTGIFAASGMAGTMFAGFMMTAIYHALNGSLGLAGWRWVFIIDGLITFPIAIFGFLYFPDTPERTNASYFSADEKSLALSRLPPKDPNGHSIDLGLVRRVLVSYEFWILVLFWVIGSALEAFSVQSLMLLWMKSTKHYTVSQNNNYPTAISAVAVVATLLTSILMDATGRHAPFGFVVCVLQVVSCVLLLCWSLPSAAKFAAYYLAGTGYAIQPICFVWANKILARSKDDAKRAVVLYAMNGASSVLYAFWGILLYPATDAPKFHKGVIAMIVAAVATSGWIILVDWLDRRTVQKEILGPRDPVDEGGEEVEEEPVLEPEAGKDSWNKV